MPAPVELRVYTMDPTCLIVIGETEDGQTFRPSDWTARLIDGVTAYGQDRRQRRDFYAGPYRRQRQSELLTGQMLDGRKCLVIDLRLREINPEAFAYVMAFVRNHALRSGLPAIYEGL